MIAAPSLTKCVCCPHSLEVLRMDMQVISHYRVVELGLFYPSPVSQTPAFTYLDGP